MLTFRGKARRFGENIRADIAIKYSPSLAPINDPLKLAQVCMVGYDPSFPQRAMPGDIIVAGRNFALGHMHPQFYYSLIGLGISAVIADSTGRRFYRDAINAGLPVLIHHGIADLVVENDELFLDLNTGTLDNVTRGDRVLLSPVPAILLEILAAGGLVQFLKRARAKNKNSH